jgi:hypothetical protein
MEMDGSQLKPGATPLHRAVGVGSSAAVELLATPGNMCRLWEGKTPLHLALEQTAPSCEECEQDGEVEWIYGRAEEEYFADNSLWCLKALLKAGSPAGIANADGITALVLAARSRNCPLAETIVALVPAMVRSECKRYKQVLEKEDEGGQQQQQPGKKRRRQQGQQQAQQQDAAAIKQGILKGVKELHGAKGAGQQQVLGQVQKELAQAGLSAKGQAGNGKRQRK